MAAVTPPQDAATEGPAGEELRALLAAAGTGTWRWNAQTGEVLWDTTLEAISGLEPGTFGSNFEAWVATLHPDEVEGILAKVNAAIDCLGSYHFEHRTRLPDGSYRWIECRGQVTSDGAGNFTGTIGCAVDITDRHRAEEERAAAFERERRLRDRVEFQARLTDLAIAADEHLEFMRAAASAAVPKLGDWCSIHFQAEPGAPLEAVVAHSDPARVEWAEEMSERFPYNPGGANGIPAVLRSGRTEFLERVTDDVIEAAIAAADDGDELRSVIEELALTSVITVPLTGPRGVLGAVQFVSAESGRRYDADDVALAEVAASRIAAALDNLWLTSQHRHISATLQRALLPPRLPDIEGIDLAARYWPAGAAVAAGGDFYDVFATAPASWSLIIGDVCGTGPDAAALTGVTRHTVRAAARHGQDHRAVLEWLNEAMRLSNRGLFCTAVYATLEGDPANGWTFTSSSAGHPRPILVRADGHCELLGPHGSLLGVLDDLTLEVTESRLEPGDAVVFYTDGITDLRPPHDRSESEFAELVAELVGAHPTSEGIADAIHRTVTDQLPEGQHADDVAILVLRVDNPG